MNGFQAYQNPCAASNWPRGPAIADIIGRSAAASRLELQFLEQHDGFEEYIESEIEPRTLERGQHLDRLAETRARPEPQQKEPAAGEFIALVVRLGQPVLGRVEVFLADPDAVQLQQAQPALRGGVAAFRVGQPAPGAINPIPGLGFGFRRRIRRRVGFCHIISFHHVLVCHVVDRLI